MQIWRMCVLYCFCIVDDVKLVFGLLRSWFYPFPHRERSMLSYITTHGDCDRVFIQDLTISDITFIKYPRYKPNMCHIPTKKERCRNWQREVNGWRKTPTQCFWTFHWEIMSKKPTSPTIADKQYSGRELVDEGELSIIAGIFLRRVGLTLGEGS